MIMEKTTVLVKSEDLNHHETLFAGRMAEWLVEASFMGASAVFGKYGEKEHLVSVEVHRMKYMGSARNGDIITFYSQALKAGRSSLSVYTKAVLNRTDKTISEGYITYVCLDGEGKVVPHGIEIDPSQHPDFEQHIKELELLQSRV